MRRLLLLLVPLALLVTACGDDDAPAAGDPATTVDPGADADEADEADEAADGAYDIESGDEDEGGDENSPTSSPEPGTADDVPAEEAPDGGHEGDGIEDPGVLLADLGGAAEVPGPGDDGASGRFESELVEGALCIDMAVDALDSEVIAAHVHEGAAGSAGPPVLDIGTPTATSGSTDTWTDVCVPVDGPLVERMATEPERFYVNVHSSSFPDGAVRGQLTLASVFDRQLS